MATAESVFQSPVELRYFLRKHLALATEYADKITRLPTDAFDDEVSPLLQELQQIEDILFEFGREKRIQADREEKAAARTKARQRHGSLEREVMRLDERVQGLMAALGGSHPFMHGMYCAMVIRAMLLLLDTLPDSAYEAYHFTPDAALASDDPRVAVIGALIRDGRQGTTSTPKEPADG